MKKLALLLTVFAFSLQLNANDISKFTDTKVSKTASFQNGQADLSAYLVDALKDERITTTGKLMLELKINASGEIEKIKVLKSIDAQTDQKIAGVVDRMPNWNPALQNGNPVPVTYHLPIVVE